MYTIKPSFIFAIEVLSDKVLLKSIISLEWSAYIQKSYPRFMPRVAFVKTLLSDSLFLLIQSLFP